MPQPTIGETRVINRSGNVRTTIGSVTKYGIGEVFQVQQTYQVIRTFKNAVNQDVLICDWVDTAFVE